MMNSREIVFVPVCTHAATLIVAHVLRRIYLFLVTYTEWEDSEGKSEKLLFWCVSLVVMINIAFILFQKCYETKQYKRGLREADMILRHNPEHGG